MSKSSRRNVAELTSGELVDQVFLISQPQLRTTSRGDFYIAAYISDRTGKTNSRMWQANEAIFKSLPEEGFVRVKGRTESYQGSLQVVVDAMRPVNADEVELEEFLPACPRDVDQMFAQLKKILTKIANPNWQRLVKAFLDDDELMTLLRKAPAAITLHHAYLGGLLEHTLSVLELGCRVLPQYPDLDADLVLTGLFLHDIGKTTELAYDLSFHYTDQGRLLGHLVKGALLIQDKIDKLNIKAAEPFPQLLAESLLHIIVSHHGVREFGCPVLPATPEAFVVHYLDNLDSKMALTFSEIAGASGTANWTSYSRALETCLFKVRPGSIAP